jgi:hypothetical protein
MMIRLRFFLFFLITSFLSSSVSAAVIVPASYDTRNGHSGAFPYWDLGYSGSGSTNTDNAPLTGGLGDLTNGVIAADNWFNVENAGGTGPYIGWRSDVLALPVVTFRFGGVVLVNSITIYVDDADGNGGVWTPASVDIGLEGGPYTNFLIADPVGSVPIALTFSGLALSGSNIDVRFIYGGQWIFVSEVTFDGSVSGVPEPSSWALAGAGLCALLLRKHFPTVRASR